MSNKPRLQGPMEVKFSNRFFENPALVSVDSPLDCKIFPPNNDRRQSKWETGPRSGSYKKGNLTEIEESPSGGAVSQRNEHGRFQEVNLGLTSHQLQKLTRFLDQMNLDEKAQHTMNGATVMTTNFKQNDKGLPGKSPGTWIVDSGATDHVACCVNMFEEVNKVHGVTVNLPNGQAVCVSHVGTVRLSDRLILRGVLCVPTFQCNLISLGKLTADEMLCVMFVDSLCCIQAKKDGERIGTARKEGGLYLLKMNEGSEVEKGVVKTVCNNTTNSTSRVLDIPPNKDLLWHLRLGHMSQQRMSVVKRIHEDVILPDSVCYVCPHARMKRLSFPLSTSTVDSPFDLIHMDIWGPYRHSTVYGHHYFLTVVDEFSRYTWVFLLKMKAEVRHLIQSFCAYVSTQFQKQVKVIRTDQGAEFRWPEFYDEKGIIHQKSCVSTPQQNGVVERKHQHY